MATVKTNIFNNAIDYYGEDIHIRQAAGTFELTDYFNTSLYLVEFLPQLRGRLGILT